MSSHPGHDPFTIPPHRATGCLPRVSKPGEWALFVRDTIKTIPRGEWAGLIGTVPNSQLIWELLDQDGVGSCAAEGCTNALLGMRELAGMPRVQLNPCTALGQDQIGAAICPVGDEYEAPDGQP